MNDVNPIVDITGKDSLAKYMEAAKKLLKFVPGLHDFAGGWTDITYKEH